MNNQAPGMLGLTKFRLLSLAFVLAFLFIFLGPVFANGDVPGDGQKTHVVKPGEHLYGIAKQFDVNLADLRKANNIEGNIIRPGQKLVIPVDGVVQTADAPGVTDFPDATDLPANTTISLDIRDADLRDVLSALAIKMGAHVLLVESPTEVSFQVKNVSPQKAFQLLLQQEGLTYIKDGNLYIVGQDGTLESNFFKHMVLTRFNLSYITASTLEGVLDQLGIPLQSITLEQNKRSMWVQATPFSLSKVRQVIAALDRPENAEDRPETAEPRQRIRVPVASADGEGARSRLVAQRELLSELTGVSISRMNISTNLSGDSADPCYLLWIDEFPDKIQLVEEMVGSIGAIDSP